MSVDDQIHSSSEFIRWLDRKIDGLSISADDRTKLAAACFDVATEHHKSIILLVSHQLYGSALAISRLLFEAYIRGAWFNRCANDIQIQRFVRTKKLKMTVNEIVRGLELHEAYSDSVLSKFTTTSLKSLNGFTHTGYEQIVRRLTTTTIEPNYSSHEISTLIGYANAMGALTGIAHCELAGEVELMNEILECSKSLYPNKKD